MKPCVIAIQSASGETFRFTPPDIHTLPEAMAWAKKYVLDMVGKWEIVTPLWVQINGYQYDIA